MSTPTGGRALAARLRAHGVDTIFLIPGVQLDWAVDALREQAPALRLIVPRHEQTTTYMADGYHRASGRPGVAMVVPGPGVLNATAGLATAYAANAKLVFIAAQVHSQGLGRGLGLLHEIADQSGVIAGLTKWMRTVREADAIGPSVDAAFAALHAGRPRPVGLEIPHDLLQARLVTDGAVGPAGSAGTVGTAGPASTAPAAADLPDPEALERAARLLDGARLPVIYVGGGIVAGDACEPLRRLAERLGAPVVMSDNGRGAISDRHPLALTTLAGRAVFEHADVALVVGSRFVDSLAPSAAWTGARLRTFHVNLDAGDLGPPRTPEIALRADAGATLAALAERVRPRAVLAPAQLDALRAWADAQIARVAPQAGMIRALRAALPEDGILVNELTQVGYLARVAFPVYAPRTYIGPSYQGTLGFGLPAALGAAVAQPQRRVLCLTGDGGFGWNMQELATARKYDLRVTLVVFNDGHFGNVRAIQKRVFGAQAEVAVDLRNPDFGLLARAFDIPYVRADDAGTLGAAVSASLAEPGPVLIEVRVGEMPSPWHLLRLQPMAGMPGGPEAPPNPLGPVPA
jgi:acetolactate synthase-1/2/3 large subunit